MPPCVFRLSRDWKFFFMRIDEGVGIWPNPTEGSWTRSLKFQSSMLCVREIVNFCFTDRAVWECCWTSVWVRRKGRKLKFCTLTCFSVCNLKKLMETGEENWHGWKFFFRFHVFAILKIFVSYMNGDWRGKLKWLGKKEKEKTKQKQNFWISRVCDIENFCFIHENIS